MWGIWISTCSYYEYITNIFPFSTRVLYTLSKYKIVYLCFPDKQAPSQEKHQGLNSSSSNIRKTTLKHTFVCARLIKTSSCVPKSIAFIMNEKHLSSRVVRDEAVNNKSVSSSFSVLSVCLYLYAEWKDKHAIRRQQFMYRHRPLFECSICSGVKARLSEDSVLWWSWLLKEVH